jgi:hypothetical protein
MTMMADYAKLRKDVANRPQNGSKPIPLGEIGDENRG